MLFAIACQAPVGSDTGDGNTEPGRSGSAAIELGPDVLDYGLVIVGSSQERILSVRNVGHRAVDLDVAMAVDIPQAFTIQPEGLTVQPNDYENVTFTFNPEAWAVFDGFAVFSEDDVEVARAEVSIEVMADRDADGWGAERHGGGDCDDDDPSVHPGMDETWYDGIDTDCDGSDDFDADGDGDPSDEHGGTDCVDDDSRISGLPDTPGCLDGALDAAVVSTPLGIPATDAWMQDLDGDGYLDLLVVAPETGLTAASGPVTDVSDLTTATTWAGRGLQQGALADLDADGHDDAVLLDPESGAVQLVYGPLIDGATADGALKLRTPGAADRPVVAIPAGDINGDGRTDVAVGWSGRGAMPAAHPRVLLFTDADGQVDLRLHGPAASDAGASILGSGDLDGDGYADLLVGAPGGDGVVWLVSGPMEVDGDLSDSAARLDGGPGSGLGESLALIDDTPWISTGDLWYRLDGGWTGVRVLEEAIQAFPQGALVASDANEDGSTDLLVGMPADDGLAWMPEPSGDVAPAPLQLMGPGNAGLGRRAAVGDLDGDGHPDILLPAPGLGELLFVAGPVAHP